MTTTAKVSERLSAFAPSELPQESGGAYMELTNRFLASGDKCWSAPAKDKVDERRVVSGLCKAVKKTGGAKVAVQNGRVYLIREAS